MTLSLQEDTLQNSGIALGHSDEWIDRTSAGQVRPLRPLRIREREWHKHPLLAFAIEEAWIVGDELRPRDLDAEQMRSFEKLHIVYEHGERVISMPPRFNGDPFVDGVSVRSADDLFGGLHPDVERYYFRCAEPEGEYLETYAAVSDGRRRRFFSTQYGPRWVEVDPAEFGACFRSDGCTMTEVTRAGINAFERQLMAQFQLEYHIADTNPLSNEWSRFLPMEAPSPVPTLSFLDEVASVADVAPAIEMTASAPSASAVATAEPVVAPTEPVPTEPAVVTTEPDVAVRPTAEPAVAHAAPAPAAEAPVAPAPVVIPTPAAVVEPEASVTIVAPVETLAVRPRREVATAQETHRFSEDDVTLAAPVRSRVAVEDVVPMSEVQALLQLARACAIATVVHRGQVDKVGAPYIDHPARIAEEFDPHDEPVAAAAAWLHNVLEDSDVTPNDLLDAGISPEVVEIVQLLTRNLETTDETYFGGIRGNAIALKVKAADIADNLAPWRLRRLDDEGKASIIAKYDRVREMLGIDVEA